MKLELKHLAPYLPYGLNGIIQDTIYDGWRSTGSKIELTSVYLSIFQNPKYVKPILRPLSDLAETIIYSNQNFTPLSFLFNSYKLENGWDYSNVNNFELWVLESNGNASDESMTLNGYLYLFEWHFDVFGLIEKGLAIDINTI